MLQPPLEKVGDRQRHPLGGGGSVVGRLLMRAMEQGHVLPVPGHHTRVLDRATAQVAR